MKKIRKIKEIRSKVSSHLNVGTVATSITHADALNQKTLNQKMAKRQKPWIYQLRILLPRLSREELSKCRLAISTIIQFSHPTRRNECEVPGIELNRRLELMTPSACSLPVDQINRTICIICAAWCFYYLYLNMSLFGTDKCVVFFLTLYLFILTFNIILY